MYQCRMETIAASTWLSQASTSPTEGLCFVMSLALQLSLAKARRGQAACCEMEEHSEEPDGTTTGRTHQL
eukprot:4951755-Karenia_brevis.AAC.1